MEGTQPTAAATRKRRSSILKSQRPSRTPFSELEFNVATPTDPGKSRRVSFSRRTGVAEFVTNEATTTWRNVYEEQNKSLESSGHDSHHAPAPGPADTMFDRQFQQMEAEIDFAGDLRAINTNANALGTSITDQFAMLENTRDDRDLIAPHNKLENTEFTENQSKIFRDDLTSAFNDLTDRVDVNFSAVKDLGKDDDLDDMLNDFQASRPDPQCPGLFSGRNASQYVEIDFNDTQGLIKMDGANVSDMSFTETIQSPKKELSIHSNMDLKISKDMSSRVVDDKENIVVNHYVPMDMDYSSRKEESQKVLVFDGKKLKYADIHDDLDDILDPGDGKSADPPKASNKPQFKRNTIVFDNNTEDADVSVTRCIPNVVIGNANQTRNFTDEIFADMSITQAVSESRRKTGCVMETIEGKENQTELEKIRNECDKTKLFDKDTNVGDVSMTEAVIGNVIKSNSNRQTILFYNNDIDADISVTRCVPEGIQFKQATDESGNNKRKTIVFNGNVMEADMSMALPDKVMPKKQTIVFETDDIEADVSMTKAIPNLLIDQTEGKNIDKVVPKRHTIVFESDDIEADVSMTKAIPNIVLNQTEGKNTDKVISKRQTIVFESDDIEADVSMTKAIPNIVLNETEGKNTDNVIPRRQTIVFSSDGIEADISVTKAIPSVVLEKREDVSLDKTANERQTIVFQSNDIDADISMTKSIPYFVLEKPEGINSDCAAPKRQTIVFQTDDIEADVSVTKAIPNVVIEKVYNLNSDDVLPKKQRIVSESSDIKSNIIEKSQIDVKTLHKVVLKKQTTVYENDNFDADVSMTRCIPNVLYDLTNAEVLNKELNYTQTNIKAGQNSDVITEANVIDNDLSISRGISNLRSLNRSNRGDVEVYNVTITKDDAKHDNTTDKSEAITSVDKQQPIESNVTKSIAHYTGIEENISKSISNANEGTENPERGFPDLKPSSVDWEIDDVIEVSQTRSNELLDRDNEDSALIDVDNLKDEECMSYVARKKSTSPKTYDVTLDTTQNHNADDTNDLLNMISDFTDKTAKETTLNDATQTALSGTHEPFAIVHTTAEITTSCKEVQAHIEKDEVKSVKFNDTIDKATSFAPSSRVPHDLVKNLDFGGDTDRSPLRKRMKSHVIPDFTISEEVKELMDDLVKPMADVPFTTPQYVPKHNSEIQANLSRVSSQAEVMTESYEAKKLASEIALLGNASITNALERGLIDQTTSDVVAVVDSVKSMKSAFGPEEPARDYILWDNTNPLNNVLIKTPNSPLKVHKYNPIHREYSAAVSAADSHDTLRPDTVTSAVKINDQPHIIKTPSMTLLYRDASNQSKHRLTFSDVDVSQKHNANDGATDDFDITTDTHNSMSKDADKKDGDPTKASCRRSSMDKKSLQSELPSTDKPNSPKKESITTHRKSSNESACEKSPRREKKSKDSIFKRLSNIASKVSVSEKRKRRSSCDVSETESKSPEDDAKSKSSGPKESKCTAKRTVSYVDLVKDDTHNSQDEDDHKDNKPQKRTSKINVMTAETLANPLKTIEDVNVMRMELSPVHVGKLRKLSSSPKEAVVLFRGNTTASEDSSLNEAMENAPSAVTLESTGRTDLESVSKSVEVAETSKPATVDSDSVEKDNPAELKSRLTPGRIEKVETVAPSVDRYESLLAMIDLLPFMGSKDCAWRCRQPPRLAFALLYGRVELGVTLGGAGVGAGGAGVGAGGADVEYSVHAVTEAKHSPITTLATTHAIASMRAACASLPTHMQVLRRCAGVALVAARWTRTMNDAAFRLALRVEQDAVVVKVANVPLRSVWEVELRVCPPRSPAACHPRVSIVRAASVVGAAVPRAQLDALVAAVPDDWGHVPRAVWKVFRHLKNMRSEDD